MSIIINQLDGSSKTVDGVHYFILKDGRSFLFYYDSAKGKIHWADLYIIDGKYYKTSESSVSNSNEFMRLLNRNIVNSKPLFGEVEEVSSEVVQNLISSRTTVASPPKTPPRYDNDSNPSVPPGYNRGSVTLPPPEDDISENKYDNVLPVIAISGEVNGELILKLYIRGYEEELREQYVGEEFGRFKHYYDVKQVGTVKLSDMKIDDLILQMLSMDKSGQSLLFKNTDNLRNDEYFAIDDLLLNYSTQSHRCEDKNIIVRDFIADDYISNNKGRESYNHYSNGNRSQFIGLKRTVFHRNSYEINRDYGEISGRGR